MSYAFVFRTTYVGMTARMHVFRLQEVRPVYVDTRILPEQFFFFSNSPATSWWKENTICDRSSSKQRDLTTLAPNEIHPKLMTRSSDIINCTKAVAKQKLLKLFQKFIFFRKFSKPTALIIQLQKSELSGRVRSRAGFQTRIICCPGRCF